MKKPEPSECEHCGCKLVPVNSMVHRKWFECIRHLNRPHLCSGTKLQDAPPWAWRREEKETG